MNRRRIILIAVAVATVAALLAWRLHNGKQANGTLTLYGNVDIRKVDLSFRVGGKLAELAPTEGNRGSAGAVVGRLDETPYREELQMAEGQREQAEAQLLKLERGYRTEEIAQAEALVLERAAAVHNLELLERRYAALLAKDTIAQQTYDTTLSSLNEAKARLATAEEGLRLVRRGYRSEDLQAARANLKAARAREDTARTRLEDTVCRAPAAGVVLTRIQEPGTVVAAGQAVLTLSLDEPAWIRAYLAEADLGWVRPGLKVEIHTDSRPGRPYPGHIGYVASEAEFTPKTIQTEELRTQLVYQVRIIVDQPDPGLRQGMPVTVNLVRPTVP